MTSNAETLASYEAAARAYIEGTPGEVSGPVRDWLERALAGVATEARLLELGSAFGRDARYVMARGYRLECTDAVEVFVSHLRARGIAARRFNALRDELTGPYELILANAVLLHFTPVECARVLAKMAGALAPSGRFAFSLKRGNGEEVSSAKLNAPRYFCYWQPEALPALLTEAGFARCEIETAHSARTEADWIYVIATKAG
ncbi:methyltransferase domain-containing protein [Acidocella sp.]|uniref:methyltransferase domain-containing protein n=1 Tax=Acidocella sp. TaxID=50710 RepID=UPI002637ED45|nr:methyltransferase domain-containing protein [Acidocella sp.]